jgi:hypothetical protein
MGPFATAHAWGLGIRAPAPQPADGEHVNGTRTDGELYAAPSKRVCIVRP